MMPLPTLAVVLALALPIHSATYKGKNIDGKKFRGVVVSDGGLVSADVRFDGRWAYLYFETWHHKVLLTKEEIENPRKITAHDGIHQWNIELLDKLD